MVKTKKKGNKISQDEKCALLSAGITNNYSKMPKRHLKQKKSASRF